MLRCEKDSEHPFLVSLSTALYIVDITCACLKLGAKQLLKQSSMHMTLYKSAVLRETRKVCNAVFYHTDILSQTVKFLKDIKNHKSCKGVS